MGARTAYAFRGIEKKPFKPENMHVFQLRAHKELLSLNRKTQKSKIYFIPMNCEKYLGNWTELSQVGLYIFST